MSGSIVGTIELILTSADPARSIAAINASGIEILQLSQTDLLTSRFTISRRDYKKLVAVCKKRGDNIQFVRKKGLFWYIHVILSRPVLLFGGTLALSLVLFLPTRILFVCTEGNQVIPTNRILVEAEGCGIHFGTSRREIRSEQIKNTLLSAIPELQWAGINTSGCTATISVRERAPISEKTPKQFVSHIVAQRDGYILSGTVTQGNGLFRPGQTVKAGDLLISGYTDCGICIRAEQAKGEILAQTNRDLQVCLPSQYLKRTREQDVKHKISLLLRKKRINLWKDSGISDTSCVRIYEEYYVTLPGGFQLPFGLCVEKFIFYDTQTEQTTEQEAKASMIQFAENYLLQLMIAGIIKSSTYVLDTCDGVFLLRGNFLCEEMIGREQIGDINGETS